MRIFICWSKGRSLTLASALDAWLPLVVDGAEPFLSSEIEPGQRWFEEISKRLRESDAGLVCLTPENVRAPWIHFEAGALATAVGGRLFTYGHRVTPERLTGPLSEFQSASTSREGTLRLVQAIAKLSSDARNDSDSVARRFDDRWPSLQKTVDALGRITIEEAIPQFKELFRSKTFTESMRECPDLGWIARHERLGRVRAILEAQHENVASLGEDHLLSLYERLQRQVDLYEMGVSSKLLKAVPFDVSADDGLLDIPPDVLRACEAPRICIEQLKERLLNPEGAPVLPDALRFERLDTLHRKALIRGLERRAMDGDPPLPREDRNRALVSFWDLDRIACYQALALEAGTAAHVMDLANHARSELERLEVSRTPLSLIPLYQAVRAVDHALKGCAAAGQPLPHPPDVLAVVAEVERYVREDADRDGHQRFADRIASIREQLGVGLGA